MLGLAGTFELLLQVLEFVRDSFAALLVHEPAEQEEHDLDEAFAAHGGFLGHAGAAVQVFEAVLGLDVENFPVKLIVDLVGGSQRVTTP